MKRFALVLALPCALVACLVNSQPPQHQPSTVTTRDHRGEPAPAAPGGTDLQTSGPIECHGHEVVALENCLIEDAKVGVHAHGNCTVTLTNCTIRSGRTAIDARGNATIRVVGGLIDAPVAIDAHGAASVIVDGAAINGDIDRHGNARVTID
jgi:hypothetical protein